MEHKRKQKQEQSVAISALIGGGVGIGITLILHLLIPFLLLMTGDPNVLTRAASAIAMAAGGAVGATVAAYFCPSAKLQSAILSAPIAFLPLVLISIIIPGSIDIISLLIGAVAYLGSALICSFLISKPKSKRKSMKKLSRQRRS